MTSGDHHGGCVSTGSNLGVGTEAAEAPTKNSVGGGQRDPTKIAPKRTSCFRLQAVDIPCAV